MNFYMQRIQKLIAVISLYWHYSLDTIVTHVFVIAFLSAGFPTIAAILMSIDSLFKVIFSVMMSRVVVLLPSSVRGQLAAVLRLILVILWFFTLRQVSTSNYSIYILIPFIFFKILLLFDSYVSSEFIFDVRQKFQLDLTQSAAAQNILIRASTAIAPSVALIILYMPHASLIAFLFAFVLYILSIISLRSIFFTTINTTFTSQNRPLSLAKLISNPFMRWGFVYQIAGNLAFAGVAFIFLKNLQPHGNLFLNEISILYFAFFLVQIIVLIFGANIIPIYKTTQVALTMGICGSFVIAASLSSPGYFRLVTCMAIGLTYSITISAVQKVVTTKLRGPGFIEYIGWAQTAGRSSSFFITMIFGFALSLGFLPNCLLMICGFLGIVSASLLFRINTADLPAIDLTGKLDDLGSRT